MNALRIQKKYAIIAVMEKDMKEYENLISQGDTGRKFSVFYEMLVRYNGMFNLTRITGEEECRVKHFLDSAAGEKFFPQGARVAEVGSGGGFPSVPLMIIRPDLRFTLMESVGKKCSFLREAVRELGLQAEVLQVRAEEAAKDRNLREKFGVCCARAVARLNTLAEYCVPFVRKGGFFIAYKGRAEDEIKEAEHAFSVLGAELVCAEKYELPGGEGERTLVVAEKVRSTPPAYPRGRGKERSRPL